MANDFVYQSQQALTEIAQELMPTLTADREAFKLFPIQTRDETRLEWDQKDSFFGLQSIRGIDGKPGMVSAVGANRFKAEYGVYGEFVPIPESIITEARQIGTWGSPRDLGDMVSEYQMMLMNRQYDLIEKIVWDLLVTGTYSVLDDGGVVRATDSFPIQTFATVVPWSTHATATPLADLKALKLYHRGQSVSFDRTSKLYVNSQTVNDLTNNLNPADLYGRRLNGLSTANNLDLVNQIFMGDNLPQIVEYDRGYRTGLTRGTNVLYIPDGKGVLVGNRPNGQTVGNYRMLRNANNPGCAPGPYSKVFDNGMDNVPRKLEVHMGHNGGPVIYYGGAVVGCDFTHTGA